MAEDSRQAGKASVVVGAIASTPLAIVGVLVVEHRYQIKLTSEAALAVGNVFAIVVGFFWETFTEVVRLQLNRWRGLK
jgi:hypothetical protein